MKFKYQAKTKEGEPQVGFVEAANKEAATTILTTHQLFILSIEATETVSWFDRVASYFGRVRSKDLVIFTRQLATLLEAHIPLTDVLKTLYEQTVHPVLKEAVYQIAEDVAAGLAFSQALDRQSNIFSPFFISMVRSAEVTGNMEKVVGFLADYMEKESVLITKARAALIYPGIIMGLFAVVAIIMITVVFPQIAPVFEQSGVQLPWYTQLLINSGKFIGQWWIALVAVVAVVLIVALDYFRTEEGKEFLDDMKIKAPLIKKVYMPLTMTRMANTASMLLRGGVPMTQAIEIVGQTIDNVIYRDTFHDIAQSIREGMHLAEAIHKFPEYFPVLVPQMIAVGEATGQVDQIFERIAGFYGREADNVINNLVDLIQPILMIGIGLLVGLLFASILLPLYQLTATIQ